MTLNVALQVAGQRKIDPEYLKEIKEVMIMKEKLDFNNMPSLYKSLEKKRDMDFEFMGCTLRDLTDRLIKRFGPTIKDALLDR